MAARRWLKALWCVLGLATVAPAVRAEPAAPIEIQDNDWQPWFFAGDPAAPPGLAKEIIDGCLRGAGYEPHFRNYPIPRMWENIRSGALDVNVLSRKPGREDFLVFGTEPILLESYQPFVRRGSAIQVRGLADFDGLRLGHLNGLSYSPEFLAYVKEREKAGTLDVTTRNISNIRKLAAGQIDIFVNTSASILWLARENGLAEEIQVLDHVVYAAEYYVALSKASPRVADKEAFMRGVDQCLRDLKAGGGYRRLQEKYGIR